MDRTGKLFGITALFDTPDSIIKAAKKRCQRRLQEI